MVGRLPHETRDAGRARVAKASEIFLPCRVITSFYPISSIRSNETHRLVHMHVVRQRETAREREPEQTNLQRAFHSKCFKRSNTLLPSPENGLHDLPQTPAPWDSGHVPEKERLSECGRRSTLLYRTSRADNDIYEREGLPPCRGIRTESDRHRGLFSSYSVADQLTNWELTLSCGASSQITRNHATLPSEGTSHPQAQTYTPTTTATQA